ncbi:acetyl-CoA synthetase-like protein [Aspergillus novofumigatus IBT 16806]|uniref:Acetyl-CoA synthetase-like protein n=1 Tax=Aspergillus novofumigatus (strain IBT 16806) TaxID=1392255 RepID=A0A2I1BUP0_ASPN1|nr:acetyl-CoA synthetase-like protein [Aspergillus novofumigatus IBT 16806]PKX89074.1 acetyl-CoA synthetase-like protein [Aspergillus novofumigatus IBT 16806]
MAQPNPLSISFKRVHRVSPVQSRFWFAEQYMSDPTQSNMAVAYRTTGDFDVRRFKRALEEVLSRHETLQTAIFMDHNTRELLQGVRVEPAPFFQYIEEDIDGAVYTREMEKAKDIVWRIDEGDAFRVTLVYFSQGVEPGLPAETAGAVPPRYTDYADAQYQAIESGNLDRQLKYWRENLMPLPEPSSLLPFSRVKERVASKDFGRHTTTTEISAACAERVKALSRTLRGSPFHFHLSVIQIILCRLLETEEICIGTTDAGRSDHRFARTLGFFVNTLPLRLRLAKGDTFTDVFRRTASTAVAALSNSAIPFGMLTDRLNVPLSSTHTPLFQIMVNYRMGETLSLPLGKTASLRYVDAVQARVPYDMSINFTPSASGPWLLEIDSRNYLYTRQSMQMFSEMYAYLLESVCEDQSLTVDRYALFPKPVIDATIRLGEGEIVDYEWPETLAERIDDITRDHAQAVAVTDAAGPHTYAELAARVNAIASALVDSGVRAGSRIVVFCEPSIEAIAAMLAVLRVGAVYVPVDVSFVAARQAAMIEDCQPSVILCQTMTVQRANKFRSQETLVLHVDDLQADDSLAPTPIRGTSSSLAIILYSSGSTGKPKGIMLQQGLFTNWIASQGRMTFSSRPETVLQQSSPGFDLGVAQVLLALCFGGNLVIVPQQMRFDPIAISRLMVAERVTMTLGTPSEHTMLLRYGSDYLTLLRSWRYAIIGGELVTDHLVREFQARLGARFSPEITIVYGPTEAGVVSMCSAGPVLGGKGPTTTTVVGNVGRALPNTALYIVDEHLNLLGPGFPGEVCIGGAVVGMGYLDAPMAKEKFIANPFASDEHRARGWTKLYKTGDQGRLLEDGSLVFIARMAGETVIKLRGIRVDLEEREGESRFLVAHVVLAPGKAVTEGQLQNILAELPLPQSIRPSILIPVDTIPTTPNGKVDRKALAMLPLPEIKSSAGPETDQSFTLAEAELKILWEQVLQGSSLPGMVIQPKSDFFSVGGTSVLLAKLQGLIRQSMTITIPLAELFKESTLGKMARMLSSKRAQVTDDTINWDEETKVPEHFLEYRSRDHCQDEHHPRTAGTIHKVLLTGSTSFIGKAILQSLLSNPSITTVHCIAVEPEQISSLPPSDRITTHPGQLMDSFLGLSQDTLNNLSTSIDLIIHAGTFGNCMNRYASMRTPNFHSTIFLAELALRAHVPMHYISSNRVTLLSGATIYPPISVSEYKPPTDGSDGLIASKWASEVFLERVAKQTRLNVCIHRPCYIVGEEAPSTDSMNCIVRFSKELGAFPAQEGMCGYLDFREVKEVAAEIIQDALKVHSGPRSLSKDGKELGAVRIMHYSSGVKVPLGELGVRLSQLYGGSYEKISTQEWLERAGRIGMEPLVRIYMEAVIEMGQKRSFPYLETHECVSVANGAGH